MAKNMKNCQIVDLDSSKEGFGCTECNAKKPQLSAKFTFFQKLQFWPGFLDFFRSGTFQRSGVFFCIAFTASKRFF
jgi:hypothetical protein